LQCSQTGDHPSEDLTKFCCKMLLWKSLFFWKQHPYIIFWICTWTMCVYILLNSRVLSGLSQIIIKFLKFSFVQLEYFMNISQKMLHLTFTHKIIPWEKLFFLEISACLKFILFLSNLLFNYNRFIDLPRTSWNLASSCHEFGEIRVQNCMFLRVFSKPGLLQSLGGHQKLHQKPLTGYQGGSFGFITMVLQKWMGPQLVRFLMLTAGSFMRTVDSLRVLKYPTKSRVLWFRSFF
jgi:hypothetical protein